MAERVDWVDVAKGVCIVMVVMMHSTLGVEKAFGEPGWMGLVVQFAKPFRMPDFFLIAGLFLASRIDSPWRLYLDSKVLHFAYFYVLWLTIQFAFKAPGMVSDDGVAATLVAYLHAFIEPWGTLWFIYHLALFFVVARLLKNVPWLVVWLGAAALEAAHIQTGSVLIDEFASRFVYFYSGAVFARFVFTLAEEASADRATALTGLALWAVLNALLVFNGYSELPGISLVLGFAGALAIVTAATVLARSRIAWALRWLGEHSIVIYLAFFLPMAVSRALILKSGLVTDVGTVALMVTACGLVTPILLYALVQRTGHGTFLFERPAWLRIAAPARPRARVRQREADEVMVAAE